MEQTDERLLELDAMSCRCDETHDCERCEWLDEYAERWLENNGTQGIASLKAANLRLEQRVQQLLESNTDQVLFRRSAESERDAVVKATQIFVGSLKVARIIPP